jgi:hypothetical protein
MPAKIQLSEEELNLVQNAQWLLTKNNIISKVFDLFGEVAHEQQQRINLQPAPKIARGENYQGLPYVMLDYPRFFGKDDVFAIRSMFWWGHYFSVTLHLKGAYKEQYKKNLLKNWSLLAQNEFYVSIGGDEWRHELTEDNYVLLSQLDPTAIESRMLATDFCKVSAKIALLQWNRSKELLCELHDIIYRSIGV